MQQISKQHPILDILGVPRNMLESVEKAKQVSFEFDRTLKRFATHKAPHRIFMTDPKTNERILIPYTAPCQQPVADLPTRKQPKSPPKRFLASTRPASV